MATPTETLARARAWAAADIDPVTQAEALQLIARAEAGDAAATAALAAAFTGRLSFGTAGLRGELAAGPNRMNRVVVAQTSAGFADFLLERARRGATSSPPSVVIGYDARINSDVFARDTAEIMSGAGIRVTLLPAPAPTPLTAFAVRHLGASAGVMITASHNPPRDNGYKVYLGDADDGSQIIPPADADIARRIDAAAARPVSELPRSTAYEVAGDSLAHAYVSRTAATVLAGMTTDSDGAAVGRDTPLRVVYTAMHGVGADLTHRVFSAAGLPIPVPVPEQLQPDGRFPTVDFPNPEEPGALDLAIRSAREIDADLVIAHDPDADRLAIALPCPEDPAGYRRLTGNELGLLLGWRAAEQARRRAATSHEPLRGALACTIVSSPELQAVAEDYGLDYVETLSGFKWVSRVPHLVFGFEEALGYLTDPEVVRDKDGISASAEALAIARECAAEGKTLWDRLDEASSRFGHFASAQITLRFPAMPEAAARIERIRATPPDRFGTRRIRRSQDLLVPGAAPVPANVLRYDLEDGSRVMIRPSGTEPKLKLYLDTANALGTAQERKEQAEAALRELERDVRSYLADDPS